MTSQLNTDKLAQAIRSKRGNIGLRQVSKEIGGISYNTLSRLEQGNVPDVDTFIRVCKWLEMNPDDFIVDGIENDERPDKKMVALLRADKTLPKSVADALIQMISLAYEQHLKTPTYKNG